MVRKHSNRYEDLGDPEEAPEFGGVALLAVVVAFIVLLCINAEHKRLKKLKESEEAENTQRSHSVQTGKVGDPMDLANDMIDLLMRNAREDSGAGLGGEWTEYSISTPAGGLRATTKAALKAQVVDYVFRLFWDYKVTPKKDA